MPGPDKQPKTSDVAQPPSAGSFDESTAEGGFATSLLAFARASDAVAATASKLKKQATLATYLRTLTRDDDLRLAVRYSGGRAFAHTDERVLGASGAIVSDVVLRLLKFDAHAFWELVVKKGEIGEALADLWTRLIASESPATPSRDILKLEDLHDCFLDLASTGNQDRKKEILYLLFSRCTHPREAAYLAKIIFSDLRTGAREGVLQAAVAQAFDRPLKTVQRTQLLVGDLDEVAVLARHDRLDTASFKLFHPIQFMLASPEEAAQDAADRIAGRTFWAEDKLDGIRAQVHKSGEGKDARIAIYTRTMDRTDESFPDVVEQIRKLPGEFLLDGEIAPWRDGVVLPFAHIQRRLGRKVLTAKMIRENPTTFIAFDILYRDGEVLMDRPLRERREALMELPSANRRDPATGALLITQVTPVTNADEIDRAFCTARDCRNEGLVLKDPESPYSPGRRGQMWLKLKTHLPTLDCVVTAAEYGHGKRRGVLSDYTFAIWDKDPTTNADAQLVNIGKAYSGVTDEEIKQLTELFLKLSRQQLGHVHVVEPKLVLEIACDQIQKSNRHASGYALRFPRIKRIRWDKRIEDADRLDRVAEIYNSGANTAKSHLVEAPKAKVEPTLFDPGD